MERGEEYVRLIVWNHIDNDGDDDDEVIVRESHQHQNRK